jgi:hypothetical protein
MMISRLFIQRLAAGHFGTAISRFRFCRGDDVRFSQFRAEKSNQTDTQQSAQAGSAHNSSV